MKTMKTLILNGSPRERGDCASLITEMKKELIGEIYEVRAYNDGIAPCIDCRYCFTHDHCAIDDGMGELYAYIAECDNVIIASPVHFSEVSGPLLSLASRFQLFYAARFFRKTPFQIARKKGALIVCGGGDGSHEKAVSTATTLFHQINAELVAKVFSLKTNELSAKDDLAARKKAHDAAVLLNTGL